MVCRVYSLALTVCSPSEVFGKYMVKLNFASQFWVKSFGFSGKLGNLSRKPAFQLSRYCLFPTSWNKECSSERSPHGPSFSRVGCLKFSYANFVKNPISAWSSLPEKAQDCIKKFFAYSCHGF